MKPLEAAKVAYLRNFIFGVEDSLVSTVGLLSGIAIAGMGSKEILVTGLVLIFVEALSMSAGSFLSESSAEEYETRSEKTSIKSYIASCIMFVSYFISGFIPLLPYVILPSADAFWISIGVTVLALMVLGYLSARISQTRPLPGILRMVIIGGLAIAIGAVVGQIAR